MKDSRLLRALRREAVDRTPVWFMRQAGRYLPEYRAIREKHGFLEMCDTPELAAEVSLQPVRRFPELDAAIIFSDILVVLRPMGVRVEFVEAGGPVIANPVASEADVDRLGTGEPVGALLEAIRIVKREARVPLLGFAGAPYTLASYLVGRAKTKAMMGTPAWTKLMGKLADAVAGHLRSQVEAGADAVQLFDSWVGALSPEEYRRHVQPYSKRVFDALPATVPSIHFGTETGPFLEAIKEAGGDAIGVDWRIPLDEAWARLGGKAIQGNLDPAALLGTRDDLLRQVDDVLARAGGRPGHIFNLGHGISRGTPPDRVADVIERVHGR